jgi:hypothetical protein
MLNGGEQADYVADTMMGKWERWSSREYSFAMFCVAAGRGNHTNC